MYAYMGEIVPWHSEPVVVVGLSRKYYRLEQGFTIYCATWLRKTYPSLLFHHSANERQGAKTGLSCKLMGQCKGWPDLMIVVQARCLGIEFKIRGNGLRQEQREVLSRLEKLGWKIAVCYTFEEFKTVVEEWILDKKTP